MAIDILEALRLRRQDHDFVPEAQLHRVAEGRHLVHERAEDGKVCRMMLRPMFEGPEAQMCIRDSWTTAQVRSS